MILVTGATGKIGSELTRLLVNQNEQVRVMVRDPEKAKTSFPNLVEVVQGDFNQPVSLNKGLEGVERAFLLSNDPTLERPFVEVAARANLKHLVKASAQMKGFEPPPNHAQVEQEIFRSGLSYTILRPVTFMQNILFFSSSIASRNAFNVLSTHAELGMVDVRDIAAVAAAALTEPVKHAGKSYVVTGPETISYARVAQILTTVLGRKIKAIELSPAELERQMQEEGSEPAMAKSFVGIAQILATGASAVVTDAVEQVTGQTPRNFEQFARDYVTAFKPS